MRYLVVIDTDILVSALLCKHPDSATIQVLEALYHQKIIPVYNEEIFCEYADVLHRKKFSFSENDIQTVICSIRDNGIYADRLTTNELLPDPKDLVFYEVCMVKREEDSMPVTGDMKHFPTKPFIVTPNELLEIISKNV